MPPTIPLHQATGRTIWQGTIHRKPWQHLITAVIPCLDHPDETKLVVELLRFQTIKPYIILVDTGSQPHNHLGLAKLRAPDVELHSIRSNSVPHPCCLIASALDLGFSLATSPYVFCTHQDCFLRDRHFLQFLADYLPHHAVAGYQISPRHFDGWEQWFGHTATLFALRELDKIGATWSLRRATSMLGRAQLPNTDWSDGKLDTETTMNLSLLQAHLPTRQIGTEQNFERTLDAWIDHPRSLVCSSLYSPAQHARARAMTDNAMEAARLRIQRWRTSGEAEPDPDDVDPLPEPTPDRHPTETTDQSECHPSTPPTHS